MKFKKGDYLILRDKYEPTFDLGKYVHIIDILDNGKYEYTESTIRSPMNDSLGRRRWHREYLEAYYIKDIKKILWHL